MLSSDSFFTAPKKSGSPGIFDSLFNSVLKYLELIFIRNSPSHLRVCLAPATLLQARAPGRETSLSDSLGSREVIDMVTISEDELNNKCK